MGLSTASQDLGPRSGTWPPHEEVFEDFSIVCGDKGLFADLTMNQVIYDLCARTHAHHLIVCLTLRALKFLIVVHRRADIQIADALQAPFNLSIRNRAEGSLPHRGRWRVCAAGGTTLAEPLIVYAPSRTLISYSRNHTNREIAVWKTPSSPSS